MKEILTDMERLREVALDQQGLVTRRQALDAGVSSASLSQLSHRGRIERMAQGIYRIPQAPYDDLTYLRLALLWTGHDDAVLGFDTALDLYGVCDILADEIHVVVPTGVRIRRSGSDGYVLHRLNVSATDRTWHQGLPVTTLARTLLDCAAWGTPSYLLRQATATALDAGLVDAPLAQEVLDSVKKRGTDG